MTTVIQNLPTPPTPADTPTEFNSKAFSLLGALPGFVTQANQLGSEMTSLGLEAGQDAEAARLHKEAAAGSAGAAAGSAAAASTSAGQAAGAASAAESARDAAAGYAASIDPAYLRNRANHTGTQPITTITGVVGTMAGGSIIERGSNANGEYVKFADGTLICTHNAPAEYAFPAVMRTYWTFPIAFASSPTVTVALNTAAGDSPAVQKAFVVQTTELNANSVALLMISAQLFVAADATNQRLYATATGVWK